MKVASVSSLVAKAPRKAMKTDQQNILARGEGTFLILNVVEGFHPFDFKVELRVIKVLKNLMESRAEFGIEDWLLVIDPQDVTQVIMELAKIEELDARVGETKRGILGEGSKGVVGVVVILVG